MLSTLQSFQEKCEEIDRYFKMLVQIDSYETYLHFPKKASYKNIPVDKDVIPVLKANVFLLLYNLVESTIRNSINDIVDVINDKELAYKALNKELRKAWVKRETKDLNAAQIDKISNTVCEILEKIHNEPFIKYEKDFINFSGNLDARKIRDIAEKIGFKISIHHAAKGGARLEDVKDKRNNLAHGNFSFSEIGREYDLSSLNEIKKQVFLYLKSVLKNVKKYLEREEYLVKTN